MWFWVGLVLAILAGLFVPAMIGEVHTGWASYLTGTAYNIPHVPKPVTFSLTSFLAVFLLVGGLLKMNN